MATITDCIRQILLEGETVVFPGFGSLIIKENKSSKEGQIVPPGKTVSFTTDTPAGNEKLSACYARTAEIDPEEARQQVLELADAIRFAFDKGENYTLTGVGVFSRNDDNKIIFTRDPMFVLEPENFGLSSLDLLELDQEEGETVNTRTEDRDVPDSNTEYQPVTHEAVLTEEFRKKPVKKSSPWKVI